MRAAATDTPRYVVCVRAIPPFLRLSVCWADWRVASTAKRLNRSGCRYGTDAHGLGTVC